MWQAIFLSEFILENISYPWTYVLGYHNTIIISYIIIYNSILFLGCDLLNADNKYNKHPASSFSSLRILDGYTKYQVLNWKWKLFTD